MTETIMTETIMGCIAGYVTTMSILILSSIHRLLVARVKQQELKNQQLQIKVNNGIVS